MYTCMCIHMCMQVYAHIYIHTMKVWCSSRWSVQRITLTSYLVSWGHRNVSWWSAEARGLAEELSEFHLAPGFELCAYASIHSSELNY